VETKGTAVTKEVAKPDEKKEDQPQGGGSSSSGGSGSGSSQGGVTVTVIDEQATKKDIEDQLNGPENITVYFAADAFILGNSMTDFIISPLKITVANGTTASQLIEKIFKDRGIETRHSGSGSDYYLQSIKYSVSDVKLSGLPTCLKNANVIKSIGSHESGWLGEFDYSDWSGWMYSVNGVYPNVGLGEYTLSDGDVVRLTFTLYGYGTDIGGGYAAGSESGSNLYTYNFLTEEIKNCAENKLSLGNLLKEAKKICK
ncbi:MAG: DUF4430 domain-containing protein, partial [Bacillota bacterium]|nr:DUF4430 domain-containing protein [Bacillota bacterium]